MLRNLQTLQGRWAFLRERGAWWWGALVLGAGLRAYLVAGTEGTLDVPIWEAHATGTRRFGLVGYYAEQEVFNHPPFMGTLMATGWASAIGLGIPFEWFLRAPFAVLDLATALLLSRLLVGSPGRHLIFAAYWLNPLAILFSAYHGNTDSAVAFFALLGIAAGVRGRPLMAGLAVGVGMSVKLPTFLVVPALFFALGGGRRRWIFALTLLGTTATLALPVLLQAPGLLYERVLAYPGLRVESPGGTPIWTLWDVFGGIPSLPAILRPTFEAVSSLHASWNSWICLGAVFLLSWLRRRESSAQGLGSTALGSYLTFYAFNHNFFSFQYLAWSVPFWFFAPSLFVVVASVAVGGYVYGAYALFCGDWLLRGKWNFYGHRDWPGWLVALRDASLVAVWSQVLVTFASTLMPRRRR
ncbi:hypothetical protein MK489_01435 [Myxococcota bacterium]|nr:hypothetical protein [Myxococcota bacterium]